MKFSEKIIQARKAKALTQEDLAEAVGVSRQAVSKWETGEAKPDLEKLMGICKVLDLSMDYLCLDKSLEENVESQPSEPEKNNRITRPLIVGVCIGLVVALLVGLLAMALTGQIWGYSQEEPLASNTHDSDYTDMLSKVKVFDVKRALISVRKWNISFVPSLQVPDMLVRIVVHDNITGSTYYPETYKMGTSYGIDYTLPDHVYDYDFIAVCTIGDVTVQLPLLHAESENGTGVTWKDTWKE